MTFKYFIRWNIYFVLKLFQRQQQTTNYLKEKKLSRKREMRKKQIELITTNVFENKKFINGDGGSGSGDDDDDVIKILM